MAPTGQASRLQYNPGQPRPQEPIPDEGQFTAKIQNLGKPGDKGWSISAPGKFPCRHVRLEILGTEDESGNNKTAMFFASSSPKAFFNIFDFAASARYPEPIDLPAPQKPNAPEVREVCEGIDKLLGWAVENDVTFPVEIAHERYKGRVNARVSFLPPVEGEETEAEENAEPAAEETDETTPEPEAESDEEQVYPKKPVAAAKKTAATVKPAAPVKKGGKR